MSGFVEAVAYEAALAKRDDLERELAVARQTIRSLQNALAEERKDDGVCPLCGHLWRQHDPEDGRCDSYSSESQGACKCGRDMPWTNKKIAALSRKALTDPPALASSGSERVQELRRVFHVCNADRRTFKEALRLERIEHAASRERMQELANALRRISLVRLDITKPEDRACHAARIEMQNIARAALAPAVEEQR